jgi:ABC-type sugar transport system ATPase subunit
MAALRADFSLPLRSFELELALDVSDTVALVGPSGAGKTSVLRAVAGLVRPSRGTIALGDDVWLDCARDVCLRPDERRVGLVFQEYALFPHMTVRQNVAYAGRERADEYLERFRISHLADARPAALSGGERQRVALGRALVRRPRLFLFDEPLSNLDAKLRTQVRAEIARLHHQLGTTMIYVTHDQVEAMTLGQRIAVLEGGRLQQCADPLTIYRRPVNRFVAGFIGSPSMNFLTAKVAPDSAQVTVGPASFAIPPEWRAALQARAGQEVVLGVRPEHWRMTTGAGAAVGLAGRVAVREPLGNETLVHVDTAAGEVVVRLAQIEPPAVEEQVALVPDSANLHAFDPSSGASLLEEVPAAAR